MRATAKITTWAKSQTPNSRPTPPHLMLQSSALNRVVRRYAVGHISAELLLRVVLKRPMAYE
jgi:hypothetical protein